VRVSAPKPATKRSETDRRLRNFRGRPAAWRETDVELPT